MKATRLMMLGLVLGWGAALIGGSAYAQSPQHKPARHRTQPTANQTIISPYGPPAPPATQPPALFRIGNLPARLWAPVPPPYDARANHNNAANPLWWNDGLM